MGDLNLKPTDNASLRVKRLDNGSVQFAIYSEPDATVIAYVDLSPASTDRIVKLVKRLRAEPLD